MKKILSRLTAKKIGVDFIDLVSGRNVYQYQRKDGSLFLANSKFESIFFYIDKKLQYNK